MKNIVLAGMLVFLTVCLYAQQTPVPGDYRSAGNGPWGTLATWQVRDGVGNWTTATSLPSSTNNVYIQKGHTVTVDVTATCNDLHLDLNGILTIGSNTVSINGKIRAFAAVAVTAVTGATDGAFYTDNPSQTTLNTTMVTSSTSGGLKFVGATRTLNLATEWNSNGTGNVSVIFAMDAGATGTLAAGFKAKTIIIQSGIVSTSQFMSAGALGTGLAFLIKNGAKFSTSRSGNSCIGFSSTNKCDNINIESGGVLEINATDPRIDCTSFTNNGTVIYLGALGTLAQPTAAGVTAGAINITSYKNLTLSGSGVKSIPAGQTITVSDTLKITNRSCVLGTTGALTYGINAYLLFDFTSGTLSLAGTSQEWPAVGAPSKIEIKSGTVNFASNVSPSTASDRIITGSLILSGGTFTISQFNTLTFSNNANLYRKSSTGGLAYTTATPGYYAVGTTTNDQVNVIIDASASVAEGKELVPNTATIGKINLTIVSGTTYSAGGRTINDFINNGTLTMTGGTLTINGDISGNGSISGLASANMVIQGSNNGSTTSPLKFTTGFENLQDLTINRTGTNASILLASTINIARDLQLLAGVLNDNGNIINLGRHISYVGSAAAGTGTHVSGAGGKIIMAANNSTNANYVGTTSLGNLEINYTTPGKLLRAATSFTADNLSFAIPGIKFNLYGNVVSIRKNLTGFASDTIWNNGNNGSPLANSRLVMLGSSNTISGVGVMDTLDIAAGASITLSSPLSVKKLFLNGTILDGGNTISNSGDVIGSGIQSGGGWMKITGSTQSISGNPSLVNLEIASGAAISATPPATGCAATISGTLMMNGGNLGIDTGNVLTIKNGATIIRSSGNLNLNGGSIALGQSSSDVINVIINDTLTSSNELPTVPTVNIDLTINDGVVYYLKGANKTVRNLSCGDATLTSDTTDPVKYALTTTGTATINGNFSLNAGLNIAGILKFGDLISGKTLTTGDKLVFKSSAGGDGILAPVQNGNNIVGTATVERYLQNKKAWRFLYSPTKHDVQTIQESWMEGGSNNNNPNPGYGIQISGPLNGAGYDTVVGSYTLKTFNPHTNVWEGVTSTLQSFTQQKGYMVFVRGDRSVTTVTQAPTPTLVRERGTLNIGDITWTNLGSDANQFVAIGNPYPSPISLANVSTQNLDNAYYLWDPIAPGSAIFGRYQTITYSGGIPTIVPGGGSYVSHSTVQSGQAFFVHTNGGPGQITFHESDKISSCNLVSRGTNSTANMSVRLNLFKKLDSRYELMDGVLTLFDQTNENVTQVRNANKMFNPTDNIFILDSNQSVSIQHHRIPTQQDSIHYSISQTSPGAYYLQIVPENITGTVTAAYLYDRLKDTVYSVSTTESSRIDIMIENNDNTFGSDRFVLFFNNATTLPLEFIQQMAVRKIDKIELTWKISDPSLSQYYTIEKSADGFSFSQIAQTQNDSYLDTDKSSSSTCYYRIVCHQKDGRNHFSKILKVNAIELFTNDIVLLPNPIGEERKMEVVFKNEVESGNYLSELWSLDGKRVMCQYTMIHSGQKNMTLQLEKKLLNGTYLLRITSGDKMKYQTEIVIR